MNNEEYEDDLTPVVQSALETLLNDEVGNQIQQQMLPYIADIAIKSLSVLNWMRREGTFPNKEYPELIGFALDNFAAAFVTASSNGKSKDSAEFYRNRRGKTGLEKVVN